jgi:hypothetical protein
VHDNQVMRCGHRELADLEVLPRPAYDLLPISHYLDLASPRIFDLYVGTGCAYGCKFCVTAPFWERTFRAKKPATILAELNALNEAFGITQANFIHDNFANNRAYLNEFLDFFTRHNTRFEWACAVRPDSLSADDIARMKASGCFRIFCGVDSGSPRVLRAMAKGMTVSDSYTFFRNCRANGMAFEVNTIIGYPRESEEDLEDSLTIALDSTANGAILSDCSVLQPLPGARVTLDNSGSLEFVEHGQLGTFLPRDVLELARANHDLFTGFTFIRGGARDYSYYASLVKLVRYFTRHHFRTIYFLKKIVGLRYVDVFRAIGCEADSENYGRGFRQFVKSIGCEGWCGPLKDDVLTYDDAVEALRAANVTRQIKNVYAEPTPLSSNTRPLVLDLKHRVHQVFASLPDVIVERGVTAPATYVLFLNEDADVVTVSLSEWQRQLWKRLEQQHRNVDSLDEIKSEFVTVLKASTRDSGDRVERSVIAAMDLFTDLLAKRG